MFSGWQGATKVGTVIVEMTPKLSDATVTGVSFESKVWCPEQARGVGVGVGEGLGLGDGEGLGAGVGLVGVPGTGTGVVWPGTGTGVVWPGTGT